MGVSTDAILFFGFPIPEDSEAAEAAALDDYDEETGPPAGTLAHLRYHGDESGDDVTLGQHCSDSWALFYVAVKGSQTRASRGHPERIEHRDAPPEWREQLRVWCDRYGVPWTEPGWYLVSWWC